MRAHSWSSCGKNSTSPPWRICSKNRPRARRASLLLGRSAAVKSVGAPKQEGSEPCGLFRWHNYGKLGVELHLVRMISFVLPLPLSPGQQPVEFFRQIVEDVLPVIAIGGRNE